MPLITLCSDFGTRDGFIGAIKGKILNLAPSAQIVDISHEIPPQDISQASWCLARAIPHFPPGSIHIAVIDPSVGSARNPLLIKYKQHWLIGPDNGIFSRLIDKNTPCDIWLLNDTTQWWQAHPSFDGLALFAPAAACIANGVKAHEIARLGKTFTRLLPPKPRMSESGIIGEIINFDHFGNAISNIEKQTLTGKFQLTCNQYEFHFQRHYSASGKKYIALINSDDLLEFAIYSGSAKHQCQLQRGDAVVLNWNEY